MAWWWWCVCPSGSELVPIIHLMSDVRRRSSSDSTRFQRGRCGSVRCGQRRPQVYRVRVPARSECWDVPQVGTAAACSRGRRGGVCLLGECRTGTWTEPYRGREALEGPVRAAVLGETPAGRAVVCEAEV